MFYMNMVSLDASSCSNTYPNNTDQPILIIHMYNQFYLSIYPSIHLYIKNKPLNAWFHQSYFHGETKGSPGSELSAPGAKSSRPAMPAGCLMMNNIDQGCG